MPPSEDHGEKKGLFRLNTKGAEIAGLCDKCVVVFILRHRIG